MVGCNFDDLLVKSGNGFVNTMAYGTERTSTCGGTDDKVKGLQSGSYKDRQQTGSTPSVISRPMASIVGQPGGDRDRAAQVAADASVEVGSTHGDRKAT